jgi:hypothetical protein
MRQDPSPDLRPVGLDPAEESDVRDIHTTVGEHQLDIAVADREHQVPADRPEDHLGGEPPTFKGLIRPYRDRSLLSRHAMGCTCHRQRGKFATKPSGLMGSTPGCPFKGCASSVSQL